MNLFSKQSNRDEESVKSTPLMFVPGEYFFIERISIPEEVLPKDLDSFLEIRLEGISPFPLDQLYWGYIHDQLERSLFLYAMYVGRLTLEEKERVLGDEVSYVFPSFIVGFGYKYSEPTINLIVSGTSISAIYWNSDNLPMQVETIGIGEFEDKGREVLLKNLDLEGYVVEAGYWNLEKAEILADRSVRFESSYHAEGASKPDHIFILNEKKGATWNADIRPKELTKVKHKEQRINRILWIATLACLLAFGILVVGEVLAFTGKAYLNTKKALVAKQAPRVKIIEGQESLAQKIEQISQNYYTPFRMLELLNTSRPKKVYFTSVTLGNQNNLVIDGVAASVDDLNKYTEDLNASGLVEKHEVGQIVSRQGRVTFKMDVKFKMSEVRESAETIEPKAQAPEKTEQPIEKSEQAVQTVEPIKQEVEPIDQSTERVGQTTEPVVEESDTE